MGIYDRDYNRQGYQGGSMGGGGVRISLPSPTPVVKWLLIANIVIFVLGSLLDPRSIDLPNGKFFIPFFAVSTRTVAQSLQLWRIISYQFLHDDFWHIFGNMLGLYFFGTMLERLWGSRRFLRFYLICGAMGGVFYTLLSLLGFLGKAYLLGASGAVLGILAAGAILFPHARVYVMGIFPLKLWVLAVILASWSILVLLSPQGENRGGQAAHIAGMAAGAVYVLWGPFMQRFRLKHQQGRWERKIAEQRGFQREVDRILSKVHESGVGSLTRNEKKILKEATEREQRSYLLNWPIGQFESRQI